MAKTQTDTTETGSGLATIGSGIAPSEAAGISMVEATPERVAEAYAAITTGELPPEVGDPGVTQRLILARIQAGSFEQSLEPTAKLASLQEWAGIPMIYQAFHFNPSTFKNENEDEGPKSSVYAVLEIADPETAETKTVQFGGVNVLMQLVKAWEEGKFPFLAELVGNKTGQGFTTYWLRQPGSGDDA